MGAHQRHNVKEIALRTYLIKSLDLVIKLGTAILVLVSFAVGALVGHGSMGSLPLTLLCGLIGGAIGWFTAVLSCGVVALLIDMRERQQRIELLLTKVSGN